MYDNYGDLLLGIFATLLFGAVVLVASRLLPGSARAGRESIMDVILKTIGWTLIWCSLLTFSCSIFVGLPLIAVVALVMVYIRSTKARKFALLSTMGVAAERMMPLVPVIDAYAAEQRGRLARQAHLLASRLRSGWLLPDALDASMGLVPRDARAAIRTGFESGALAAALKNAGGDRDSQDAIWAQLGGKLVYLAVVMLAINFLATYMMWKIVPAYERIFADFAVTLPGITQFSIEAAHLFVTYFGGAAVYLMMPFLWFLVAYSVLRYTGLIEWDLPGMTRVARRLHTAAILDTLAPLALQDRPLTDGISTLARSYPKPLIRRRLKRVLADLEAGMDWCDSMVRRRLLGRGGPGSVAGGRAGGKPVLGNDRNGQQQSPPDGLSMSDLASGRVRSGNLDDGDRCVGILRIVLLSFGEFGAGPGVMNQTRNTKRRRCGFTLLEVLISGTLLGAVLIVSAQMVWGIARQREAILDRQTALAEAGNVMERLFARSWEELTEEAVKDVQLSDDFEGAVFRRQALDRDWHVARGSSRKADPGKGELDSQAGPA